MTRPTPCPATTARVLDFVYDNSGKPFALRYSTNGGSSYATYYYVLNLQGDVVKLVRIYAGTTIQEYEEMASYTYNAWGEIISSSGSMADINLQNEITVVGCWAHLRRKFDEAVKSLPKGKANGSSASQGLAYCTLLFKIEEGLSEATAEERYQERLKHAKPVLDAMLAWANSRTAAPKSALGKAFTYLKEQWPYLTNYLEDGRLEISNNRAERSIKPFVIDRKNFLFANTPKGATGSAIMFSLIQTAIENNLDPYQYLTWLLKTANNADLEDEQTVQSLLPWTAPSECKAK